MQIEHTFSSDMVAVCNVFGLYGPKSTFPCYLCETAAENFANYQEQFIRRTKETQDEIIKNNGSHPARLFKNAKTHWGYKNSSLLDNYITYDKIVIELLHLWLNITKRLLRNIARDIARHNEVSIDKLNRSKHSSFNMYFDYLQNICKLKSLKPNPNTVKSVESLHSDMTGVDAERFFSNLLYLKPLFELFTRGL